MSRNELIDAYQSGRISRRVFIQGLVGLGMSLSLATALADRVRAASGTVASGRGLSPTTDDIYDPGTPEEPASQLPDTGAGEPSSSSSATKTIAVLGAGAAAVAGILRRKTDKTANGTE